MENYIIKHCAPTLAGLKTSNMVNLTFESELVLDTTLYELNNKLNNKGVYFKILKVCKNKALIYVYRKSKLLKDISNPEVINLLIQNGYTTDNLDLLIDQLSEKLRKSCEFPHEIGLFLGYPVSDVVGFINNEGKNHCLCGYWKVYENAEEAQKTFDKFKKCTAVYCRRLAEGFSISRLTVAA